MTASKNSSPDSYAVSSDPKSDEKGWRDIPEYRLELVRDRTIKPRAALPNRYPSKIQEQAVTILHEMMDKSPTEQFVVLMLDSSYNIVGAHRVGIGDLESVGAHTRNIFRAAVVASVPKIIISHCHPTGIAKASDEDLMVTMSAIEAGALIGIEVVDHIIVAPDGTDYSMFDHQDELADVINRQLTKNGNPINMLMDNFFKQMLDEGDPSKPSLARKDPMMIRKDAISKLLPQGMPFPFRKKPTGN